MAKTIKPKTSEGVEEDFELNHKILRASWLSNAHIQKYIGNKFIKLKISMHVKEDVELNHK